MTNYVFEHWLDTCCQIMHLEEKIRKAGAAMAKRQYQRSLMHAKIRCYTYEWIMAGKHS